MHYHNLAVALLGIFAATAGAPATAQMSLLPPGCAHLAGDALDQCVRDITAPQIVPKLEALEPPPPDPAALANCTRVLAADRDYCVWRNEIVLACRNKTKYPDFGACYAAFIPNIARPVAANCAREKTELRGACTARNLVYAKCLEEPLGYFLCLANGGKLPERLLKP
jgi:hypothetical protein